MTLRFALLAVSILALLAASGCDVLKKNIATAGPQRFKSEISSVAQDMRDQLTNQGKLTPATRDKFDKILTRWEGEMGGGNTFRLLREAQAELDKMESDAGNAFQHKQLAEYKLAEAQKQLETEVPSGV